MRRTLIIALGITLCGAEAQAYTVSQAAACYPDAVRLCSTPRDWRKATLGQRIEIIGCMLARSAPHRRLPLAAARPQEHGGSFDPAWPFLDQRDREMLRLPGRRKSHAITVGPHRNRNRRSGFGEDCR